MTKQILSALMTVLSEDDAKAVIEHRKITMKRPLTVRGASNLAGQFSKVDNPTAAVDMMIDRNWQGFKAEWFNNSTRNAGQIAKTTQSFIKRREQLRLVHNG